MKPEELKGKEYDIFMSAIRLLIDNNIMLKTMLDIQIKNNQITEEEVELLLSKNKELSLDLLTILNS